MRRFLPGATSFKNSSSVRVENALLALSTTSCQELIATCTDNSWDVIGTSLSLDSRPSFMQPSGSCHLFGAESLVGFQVGIGDAQRTAAFIYPRSIPVNGWMLRAPFGRISFHFFAATLLLGLRV